MKASINKKPGFFANAMATVISAPGRTIMVIKDQVDETQRAKAINDLRLANDRDELTADEKAEAESLYPGIFDKDPEKKEEPKTGNKALAKLKDLNTKTSATASKALGVLKGTPVPDQDKEPVKVPEPFTTPQTS